MKRSIYIFLLALIACSRIAAQDLIQRVPDNASLVIRYAGDIFSAKLPEEKLESYAFVKSMLMRTLRLDSFTSIKQMGLDLTQNTYQYGQSTDSSFQLVSTFHIRDRELFKKFLQKAYNGRLEVKTQNGFEQAELGEDFYAGWNDSIAVFVMTTLDNRYTIEPMPDLDESASVAADTVAAVVEAPKVEAPIIKQKPAIKNKKGVQKKPTAAIKSKKSGNKQGTLRKPKKPARIYDEEVVVVERSEEDRIQDSIRDARREFWYQQQEQKKTAIIRGIGQAKLEEIFNAAAGISSIGKQTDYTTIVDDKAQLSIWINYDNLINLYWKAIMGNALHIPSKLGAIDSTNKMSSKTAINVYFDNDQLRMVSKMITPDPSLSAKTAAVYQSKQSLRNTDFINPDHLALMSISINTEAMAYYYYDLIKKYINQIPNTKEYADLINVYIDLLEIIIDEKAIADLLPGNMLFVLHDLQNKTVHYSENEYDKEFNGKEVKKTKQEITPDFSVIIDTRKEVFVNKLLNLPVKYAEKFHFNYHQIGDYYELAFDPEKDVLKNLYFILKEGKLVITTSKEVLDVTLNHGSLHPDSTSMNQVLNNNYYLHVNSNRIIQRLQSQFSTGLIHSITEYLNQNLGDLTMKSQLNGQILEATSTIKINGNHQNSLEAIFNMIRDINQIIEKDKADQQKTLQ